MQFFEHQDQARGRTSLLVVLFALSVFGLVAASASGTHLALTIERLPGEALGDNHWSHVGLAASLTFGIIFAGSAYRLIQLRKGGVKVAETLGGTLASAASNDLLEARVVNIVEEMAIAAGLVVPPVYILRRESGINAFAAGWSPDDAVIGVTQGALEGLNRDQLQGIVAHEFSHILNRDCALNMRLMGVLHGIVLISLIGRIMLRFGTGSRRSRGRGDAQSYLAVIGGAIWLFGSLGVLVARLIQSAVSRQREYLADASAVQFTRNPEGIGGALATIGSQSSALSSPRGAETSHMLIGEPGSATYLSVLASHPPLFERIQRVLPTWDGNFAALATPEGSVRKRLEAQHSQNKTDPVGEEASSLLFQAGCLLASLPPKLKRAAEEAFSARALICAWVLDEKESPQAAQLALLGGDLPLQEEALRLHRLLPSLDDKAKLPLFDIAAGAMALLSDKQKNRFAQILLSLRAQLSPHAYQRYCLSTLALRHLGSERKTKRKNRTLVKTAIETVLAVLALQGHDSKKEAQEAFLNGTASLGSRGKSLRFPPARALTVQTLDASLSTLLRLPEGTRAQLLDAAESVAASDGQVRPNEAELLRTMAACLGLATKPAFAS